MRWSFFNIVFGLVVASVIGVLVAYGVAILFIYALLSEIKW